LKPLPFSTNDLVQSELPGISLVEDALEKLAASGVEERGAVFTRREVVEFMLDLAGYMPDRPLFEMSLLEPSFGDGDFLFPVVDRLLASVRQHQGQLNTEHIFETLQPCLRAVELHRATYDGTFAQLAAHLEKSGIAPEAASALCEAWLIGGDFLLTIMNGGSPPNMKALQS